MRGSNWSRKVCTNLIIEAAKNKEHLEAAVDLISKWENLSDYTKKVENQSSFNYDRLPRSTNINYLN